MNLFIPKGEEKYMDERLEEYSPGEPIRRRRQLTPWQRFWKRYGPTVEFFGVCILILAVLVFAVVKIVSLATGDGQPEETVATTEATEATTEPPTEPPSTAAPEGCAHTKCARFSL